MWKRFEQMKSWPGGIRGWLRLALGSPQFGRAWSLWVVLGLVGLPGCASVDEWGRAKVYTPMVVEGLPQWQDLVADRPDVKTFFVPVGADGDRVAVLSVPANGSVGSRVRVLYLHGTFRHAVRNLPKTAPMVRAGMDVFVPDYRGWGISSARLPSEDSIIEDASAVWQALQTASAPDAQGRPVRWVIYGHSMGSAVAVALAERLRGEGRYCALVLESAFTTFSDVAYEAVGWPGRWLVAMSRQRMDSLAHIGGAAPPIWFLHGENDSTVPMALGRRLFDAAPEPKHWAQWPLGHSNLHTDPTGRYDRLWQEIGTACGGPVAPARP